jgi:hypothetical protein
MTSLLPDNSVAIWEKLEMRKTHLFTGIVAAVAALAAGRQVNADTVTWAVWNTPATSTGLTSGAATATMGAINVNYTGEVESVDPLGAYPSWNPASTYTDGTFITNAPAPSDGIVQLFGGQGTSTDTITFSTPVANPVMAVWSLGSVVSGPDPATFDFTASEPFAIIAGGPSQEYGGSSIFLTGGGSDVTGLEGNGTIEFYGTYSSITFTTPSFENWYGFTVGMSSVAIPAPASALSGGVLLAGLALAKKRHNRRQA